MLAAVGGAVKRGIADVDHVCIARVDGDTAEIPAALPDAAVIAYPLPARAAVFRTVEPAVGRVDEREDALRHRGCDGEPDAAGTFGQAVAAQLRPGSAAVLRLVEPAAGPVRRRVDIPRWPACLPQRGVDDLGPPGLGCQIDRAGVGVAVERALPGPAAIGRAEYTAHLVGAVGMPERGDQHHVRVVRIDENAADLLGVAESDRPPAAPEVVGAEHAGSLGDVRAHVGLAGTDIDDPAIRGRDRQRADRADRRRVEDRLPGAPGVTRFPHAAVHRAEVEIVRLAGHAADGEHAPAAERADGAPVQHLEERRRHLPRVEGGRGGGGSCGGEVRRAAARRSRHKRRDRRRNSAYVPHDSPRFTSTETSIVYSTATWAADAMLSPTPTEPGSETSARVLILKRGEERRLAAGHLWVFSNEGDTARTPLTAFQPGELALLRTHRGALLGHVYVNPHALICARILSRLADEPVDAALIERRLRSALALR